MSENRSFKINKDFWCDGVDLFEHKSFTLKPGFTTLVGCNGSGKSTILLYLRKQFEKDKTPFYKYDNLADGGHIALDVAQDKDMIGFAKRALSSEGENIHINVGECANEIGEEIQKLSLDSTNKSENKQYWILLDAIDSGASIDNLMEMKEFFTLVIDDAKRIGIKVFIVAAANSYELVRGSMPFDVRHCKYITINSYEEYYDFVIESSKIKEKRYDDINNSDYEIRSKKKW